MSTAAQDGVQPWNPRVQRNINERVLFDALRTAGTTSRARLARTTGLSKPTVSAALAELERSGLVRPTGELAQGEGRGRAAVLYELNPAAGFVVGVDIGREWIRAAVAGLDGAQRGRRDARNTAGDARELARQAADLARGVAEEAGLAWSAVLHTVVGGPGVIDPGTHRVHYAYNLPGLQSDDLFERMRTEFGPQFGLLNDADLAALGEYAAGAGRGCPLFAYLWVGTGVGAGYVIDGKAFRGAHGAAGEIGYLPFHPLPVEGETAVGEQLGAGLLEGAVAAYGVVRLARALGMPGAGSAKEVYDAARAQDPAAVKAVEHHGARLAYAVAAIAAVLDPELVVLGGGIGRNTDLLLPPLEKALRALTPLRPHVVPAELGDDAVLTGALSVAAQAARRRVFEGRAAGGSGF